MPSALTVAAAPPIGPVGVAAAAVTRMPVVAVGFVAPSNVMRPIAVPPFAVMTTTLVMSSPATLTGSDAVSPSDPSPPPITARNVMLSPPPS